MHNSLSGTEAADRLAIRELIEAYAHCADRRDAKGQMALFTEDTHFAVYMNAKDPKPSQELHSREALAPVFADLNKYEATTHFRRPDHDLGARSRPCDRRELLPRSPCLDRGRSPPPYAGLASLLRYCDSF